MAKRYIGFLLVLVLALTASFACANTVADQFSNGLAWFEVNGKYGFVNTKGETVIPAQWDYARNFNESGYAVVFNGTLRQSGGPDVGKYGLIDRDGRYVLEMTECHGVQTYRMEDDGYYYISYEAGEWNWVYEHRTIDGRILGNRIWEDSRSGSIPVPVKDENNKWGYADFDSGVVIGCKYENAYAFVNGIGLVEQKNAKGQEAYSYIDMKENVLFSGDWNSAWPFTKDGFARVYQGTLDKYGSPDTGRYAFINTSGEYICGFDYDSAKDFKEGLAAVAVTNAKGKTSWGYIDASGNCVIPPQWDYTYPFSDGCALVFSGTLTEWGSPDAGVYGYIGKNGEAISEPQWAEADPFDNGLAKVAQADAKGDLKYGYIRTDGSIAIQPEWETLSKFSEGKAVVKRDGKYGYINEAGELVIPAKWVKAGLFSDGVAIVWDDSTWYIIDADGNVVF